MVGRTVLSAVALLFATTAHAVTVPANLEPGMYEIPFSDDGEALSAPVPLLLEDSEYAIMKRQRALPQGQVTCGASTLNIGVWTGAKENFQAMCDRAQTYDANVVVMYTSGNTIAYMCNFSRANRCWRDEFQAAMDQILRRCGNGRGGEVYIQEYDKTYGGDTFQPGAELRICGH